MPDDLPARLGTLLRVAADRPDLTTAADLFQRARVRRARRVRMRSLAVVAAAVVAVIGLVTGTLHRPATNGPAVPVLPACPATASGLDALRSAGVPRPLPSDLRDDRLLPWTPVAGTICRYDLPGIGEHGDPLLKQAPIPAAALATLPHRLNSLPVDHGQYACLAVAGGTDVLILARPAGGWVVIAYHRGECHPVEDGLHSRRLAGADLSSWMDAILGRPWGWY